MRIDVNLGAGSVSGGRTPRDPARAQEREQMAEERRAQAQQRLLQAGERIAQAQARLGIGAESIRIRQASVGLAAGRLAERQDALTQRMGRTQARALADDDARAQQRGRAHVQALAEQDRRGLQFSLMQERAQKALAGPMGPAQRLAIARQQYQRSISDPMATAAQRADAYRRVSGLEEAAARPMTAQSAAQRLMEQQKADRTTRGGILGAISGGGVTTAEVAPFVAVVGGTIAAFKLLTDAVRDSVSSLQHFTQLQVSSGATPLETARLKTLGAALGMKPEQVGAAAMQLSQSLSSNPMAMAQLGMFDLPGPFGKLNKAQQLFQAIDKMRGMSDEQATRLVRSAPELAPFLALRNMPDKGIGILAEGARMQAELNTGPRAQQMMMAGAAQAQLANQADILKQFGVQGIVRKVFGGAGFDPSQGFTMGQRSLAGGPMPGGGGFAFPSFGGNGSNMVDLSKKQLNATQEVANNTYRTAILMDKMTRQIFGGGDMARGATPASWRAFGLDQAMTGLARSLGAFGYL